MGKHKKFYAVARGREIGVFTLWEGDGGAENATKGFPHAKHMSFATRLEADQFLRLHAGVPVPPPPLPPPTMPPPPSSTVAKRARSDNDDRTDYDE